MSKIDELERFNFNLNELLDKGILQEVNRQFFHPLGLTLAIIVDSDTGEVKSIGPIYDTDDPEGWSYGRIDINKVNAFKKWKANRAPRRLEKLGFIIQSDDDE